MSKFVTTANTEVNHLSSAKFRLKMKMEKENLSDKGEERKNSGGIHAKFWRGHITGTYIFQFWISDVKLSLMKLVKQIPGPQLCKLCWDHNFQQK